MDMDENTDAEGIEQLLATPALADALESDRFKQFLDHVPVAIAVSDVGASEAIFYCNLEFERLTGQPAAKIQGNDWKVLPGVAARARRRHFVKRGRSKRPGIYRDLHHRSGRRLRRCRCVVEHDRERRGRADIPPSGLGEDRAA